MWSVVGASLQPALGLLTKLPGIRRAASPILPPKPFTQQPDTPRETLDAQIQKLASCKKEWVEKDVAERVQILNRVMDNMMLVAPLLASDCAQAKGSYGAGSGEELTALIGAVMGLRGYIDALQAQGAPQPMAMRSRANGQLVAQVFPQGLSGLLFGGFKGEVWIQPGQEASQGKLYRDKAAGRPPHPEGAVALVLGAGNQVSVVLLDVLHKLIAEDEAVILKLNSVNDYVGPHLLRIFRPFVDGGWFQIAYGGKEVGEYLAKHPQVDTIHLTGSADTFNAIVWGSATAPRTGTPQISKPITAELGNVTPYIVVPPPAGVSWSQEDMQFQAGNLAAGLLHNCGHNCVKLEVSITAQDWPQREAFLAVLRSTLDAMPRRRPWYPGSAAKLASFKSAFPSAKELGSPLEGADKGSPVLFAEGLRPGDARCDVENWSAALQEVALPGTGEDVAKFLAAAADFANDRCWGSLVCGVVAHPKSMEAVGSAAFEDFIAKLRYGAIAINVTTTLPFAVPALTWGAYPGNTSADIGSGIGYVHNTSLFDHPEKSVLTGPWRYEPRPFWWVDHTNLEAVSMLSLQLIAAGGASKGLPGLLGTLRVLYYVQLAAVQAVMG